MLTFEFSNKCSVNKCEMKCDDCRVRSKALLVLRNVLSRLDANQISERECKLFSDFLQDLSVHAKDKDCFQFCLKHEPYY